MARYLGLRYRYDNEAASGEEVSTKGVETPMEALRALSDEERAAVYDAAVLLDAEAFEAVVRRMETAHPDVAAWLRELAGRWEYHRIVNVIKDLEAGRKT
jgi:hypothetical protein